MKSYGIRNKLRVNFTDHYPKKGWINWWEDEIHAVKNKKSIRQKIKKLLHGRDFSDI
jgi:hypothetical protein